MRRSCEPASDSRDRGDEAKKYAWRMVAGESKRAGGGTDWERQALTMFWTLRVVS